MTDKVIRLADVRAMTPHEIVAAQEAGQLDVAALGRERAAEHASAAERGARIRELIRAGTPAAEAVEQVDADLAEHAAKVAAADANVDAARAALREVQAARGDLPPAA